MSRREGREVLQRNEKEIELLRHDPPALPDPLRLPPTSVPRFSLVKTPLGLDDSADKPDENLVAKVVTGTTIP